MYKERERQIEKEAEAERKWIWTFSHCILIGVHNQKSVDTLTYKAAKVVFQKYQKYNLL